MTSAAAPKAPTAVVAPALTPPPARRPLLAMVGIIIAVWGIWSLTALLPATFGRCRPDWYCTDLALASAIAFGAAALALRFSRHPTLASSVAALGGLSLMLKPIVRPLSWAFNGQSDTYSLTSETHLYFLLGGAALLCLAYVLWVVAPPYRRSQ